MKIYFEPADEEGNEYYVSEGGRPVSRLTTNEIWEIIHMSLRSHEDILICYAKGLEQFADKKGA